MHNFIGAYRGKGLKCTSPQILQANFEITELQATYLLSRIFFFFWAKLKFCPHVYKNKSTPIINYTRRHKTYFTLQEKNESL